MPAEEALVCIALGCNVVASYGQACIAPDYLSKKQWKFSHKITWHLEVAWDWPSLCDHRAELRGVLETAAEVVGSMMCMSLFPSRAHPARTDISATTPACSTAVLDVQASFNFDRSKIYKSVTLFLCYITGLVVFVPLHLVLLKFLTLWRCALCGWFQVLVMWSCVVQI